MNIFSVIVKRQEYRTRREALIQLRALTDRALIDCNFSPELVKEGVKAWPWQIPPEEPVRFSFVDTLPAGKQAQPVEQDATQSLEERIEEQELQSESESLSRRSAA